MKDIKKLLLIIAAVILAVVVVVWLFVGGTKHIEDTNGDDNYALQTITDKDIIDKDMDSVGSFKKSKVAGSSMEFSSEKFTGVYEILFDNFVGSSDFVIKLTNYEIHGGNFKMVVVHNDKIVATLEPGMYVDYCLDNVTGTVSLRIAGESASFKFFMDESEYNSHAHSD